mgnify:CR=1 FL=1
MALFDLSRYSDETLYCLEEFRENADILANRSNLKKIKEIQASLGDHDFFSYFRIILIRSEIAEQKKDTDTALALLLEFLKIYEPFFKKMNPKALNPFAVGIYSRIGDLYVRYYQPGMRASEFYLKINDLEKLDEESASVLLKAASRIVKGAWLRYQATHDTGYTLTLSYGLDLFNYATTVGFFKKYQDFIYVRFKNKKQLIPKPYFFREIQMEAKIISEVVDEIHTRLSLDPAAPSDTEEN